MARRSKVSAGGNRRIQALLLDLGGVLLTNGWDHSMRQDAAKRFGLELADMEERHHLTFDTYEQGKLSLDDYLDRVVFWRKRSFSRRSFRDFMFSCSRPNEEMIDLVRAIKERHGIRTVAVTNEGRELLVERIRRFHLSNVIDFFVGSCFAHIRKPDVDIFHMALDMTQVAPRQAVYIEDREMFVQVARGLGLHCIHHQRRENTEAALAKLGLPR